MKTLLTVLLVLSMTTVLFAQEAALSPSVSLSIPIATKIQIRSIEILPFEQRMVVTYRWTDTSGNFITTAGSGGRYEFTWTCFNTPAQLEANCVSVGVPYACCTGVGTGTGCNPANMCFNETFGFSIRAQDVGTTLGKGMRAIIINKMKASIPSLSGVAITFAD